MADQARSARRTEEDFDRGCTFAVNGRDQTLRNNAAHVQRQVLKLLRVPFFREEVDDPVHGLVGIVCVQRRQAKVACFGKRQRVLNGLPMTDLANQDDVGACRTVLASASS